MSFEMSLTLLLPALVLPLDHHTTGISACDLLSFFLTGKSATLRKKTVGKLKLQAKGDSFFTLFFHKNEICYSRKKVTKRHYYRNLFFTMVPVSNRGR